MFSLSPQGVFTPIPKYKRVHAHDREAGSLRKGVDPAAAFMDAAFENEMNRLVAATKDKCVMWGCPVTWIGGCGALCTTTYS